MRRRAGWPSLLQTLCCWEGRLWPGVPGVGWTAMGAVSDGRLKTALVLGYPHTVAEGLPAGCRVWQQIWNARQGRMVGQAAKVTQWGHRCAPVVHPSSLVPSTRLHANARVTSLGLQLGKRSCCRPLPLFPSEVKEECRKAPPVVPQVAVFRMVTPTQSHLTMLTKPAEDLLELRRPSLNVAEFIVLLLLYS